MNEPPILGNEERPAGFQYNALASSATAVDYTGNFDLNVSLNISGNIIEATTANGINVDLFDQPFDIVDILNNTISAAAGIGINVIDFSTAAGAIDISGNNVITATSDCKLNGVGCTP